MILKENRLSFRFLILGIIMIIAGIIIWREISFFISGLGVVSIGVSLMIYFNRSRK